MLGINSKTTVRVYAQNQHFSPNELWYSAETNNKKWDIDHMAGSKQAMMLSGIMQKILNVFLLGLTVILTLFLGRETYHLGQVLFLKNDESSSYLLIEGIVTYFLYFEFIALIVKYFSSGYHFPLRYFIYIGITAIIRLIIVDHTSPLDTLLYSFAILILVITLFLANSERLRRE